MPCASRQRALPRRDQSVPANEARVPRRPCRGGRRSLTARVQDGGEVVASRIEDYGLIGNTYTAALVSRTGSIDWLSAPRFDSDACFSALVGYDEHGCWALRPTVKVRETKQRYRDQTMILETEFFCEGGVVRVTDFMPMRERGRCDVVRIVEGLEGQVPVELLLAVRFGYGADIPWITTQGNDVRFVAGPDALILRSPVPTRIRGDRVS